MTEPLWQDAAIRSTLTCYPPPSDRATGSAMVICPGGGYGALADHEGDPVARWINDLGVAACVLRYRLGPEHRHPAMLEDAARAVRTVRARAPESGVDPNRIAILGFSAGGHLAATLATHFDAGNPAAEDPVDRVSSRPDAAVLIYPVITLEGPYAHAGSRQNLLGPSPDPETITLLSNHLQVTSSTPPVFLIHSADDSGVPPENSLMMALALSRARVPYELHLYEIGGHGYGLAPGHPVLATWPRLCAEWLRGRGFLAPRTSVSP